MPGREIACPQCSIPLFEDNCTKHCRYCTWRQCPACQRWFDGRKARDFGGFDPL